jgi:hypothetical protein
MTFFTRRTLVALLALGSGATLLPAQSAKLPELRPLTRVLSRSTESLGSIATAVPLPGGRVLVNDILQRRVVMFDSTLTQVAVVADTTPATGNAYGARGGGLIGFRGDSALFIDPVSLSMMTVNATGELTTIRAVPRAQEVNAFTGAQGRPGFDSKGRLVYRGVPRPRFGGANARPSVGNFVIPELPDSAPIVRLDMGTRTIDTASSIKFNRPDVKVSQGADGRISVQTRTNPFPMIDEWALLSDGTVAVIRGHDFHIERLHPDGRVTSSAKLPFEWQKLDEDAKLFLLDSARTALEKQREEAQRLIAAGGAGAFFAGGGADMFMGGGMGGGPVGMSISVGGGAGGGGPPQRGGQGGGQAGGGQGGRGGAGGGAGGPGGANFQLPAVQLVDPVDLPDYRPPFTPNAAIGDLDGNLWVRTTAVAGDLGPIYYVIDAKDQIVDRVQLPPGRILSGFGPGGTLYLAVRDTAGKTYLERVSLK